ncbi:tetratricopeptide repeat protein [Fulvivirga sediminis]|uniref:Tetratricopeptide repeat protein n=1 Tax=Fulvivirga sediminis TaxID=2803949 RepID=A0A937F6S8_9BACT|nr:tetratricopeptide repeat protein [Fulvivirga sediminis]MBL3655679.1 hypothetical protein [Fulvivirga sediminis]
MNKQKFIKIVKNYNNISEEDRTKLHELVKNYPYSQILHTLIAKANNDANTDIATQTLQYAALYASDRHVLRDIIEEKPVEEEVIATDDEESETIEKTGFSVSIDENGLQSEELRDSVLLDLEALRKSKESYLEWVEEHPEVEKQTSSKNTTKKSTEESSASKDSKATSSKESTAKKAAKTSTKSTSKKSTASNKKTTTAKAKPKAKTSEAKDGGSTTKRKTSSTPSKTNKEEQDQIIAQFINSEPSLSAKAKPSSAAQVDLSESSTHFSDDLVSENLAKILIGQGKKDKAIDIYKKLIWKFPQKKSYFATQIKDLQK